MHVASFHGQSFSRAHFSTSRWPPFAANAAEAGHLEILKWARANGCPWDEKTCEFAASRGYVEAYISLADARESVRTAESDSETADEASDAEGGGR